MGLKASISDSAEPTRSWFSKVCYGQMERKRTNLTVNEGRMCAQEVDAQVSVMEAFFKDGKEGNCMAISDAYMNESHSNDRCCSAVDNFNELYYCRLEYLLDLVRKINGHNRKWSPSVKRSGTHTVDFYINKVPFGLFGQ